jgi:hypothetical protein
LERAKGIEPKSGNGRNAREYANRRENREETCDELRRIKTRCDALNRRFGLQKFTSGNLFNKNLAV